jgi:hypothetical protein
VPDQTQDREIHRRDRLPGDTFGVEISQLPPKCPPLIVEPVGQQSPEIGIRLRFIFLGDVEAVEIVRSHIGRFLHRPGRGLRKIFETS